ncbi:MAG TPA: hypothetical protein VFW02_10520 [Candidatus Limnocylindrales bacterium]|nr:hypothetical protein [Candidatus Limnocylindrales bacterium]
MTVSLLAELEQAELEARAKRLAAEAEVDRRLAAAQDAAQAVADTGDREIDTALTALRERYREVADADIAVAEAELAECDRQASEQHEAGPGFEAAVDAIVAAVLGEVEA